MHRLANDIFSQHRPESCPPVAAPRKRRLAGAFNWMSWRLPCRSITSPSRMARPSPSCGDEGAELMSGIGHRQGIGAFRHEIAEKICAASRFSHSTSSPSSLARASFSLTNCGDTKHSRAPAWQRTAPAAVHSCCRTENALQRGVAERLAHGPKVGRRGGRRKAEAPGVGLEASPKDTSRCRPGSFQRQQSEINYLSLLKQFMMDCSEVGVGSMLGFFFGFNMRLGRLHYFLSSLGIGVVFAAIIFRWLPSSSAIPFQARRHRPVRC